MIHAWEAPILFFGNHGILISGLLAMGLGNLSTWAQVLTLRYPGWGLTPRNPDFRAIGDRAGQFKYLALFISS